MPTSLDDFRTYLREVLAAPKPTLPAPHQRLGAVEAEWFEVEPRVAVIMTTGGTPHDRCWAEYYVREQLRPHGYRQATIDMEGAALRKTASWSDIMAKAKRLIQSGQVTVMRNGSTNVVGHVVGDHGEYNTEFSREDPESGVITQWQCECPWAQYAWGRTRQWKKYEGRVCAHTLALYWKSRSTQLDDAPQGGPAAPGQRQGPGGQMQLPVRSPGGEVPSSPPPGPAGPAPSPASPAPSQGDQGQLFAPDAMGQMPQSPAVIPPFPGDQMSLFDQWQGPGTTPGGGQSPPWAVSVPGAKQPSPFNPIQGPSTLSKVAGRDLNPGDRVVLLEDEYGTKEGRSGAYDGGEWTMVPAGTSGDVFDTDPTTGLASVLFQLKGGPMSSYHVRCYVDRKSVKPVGGRPTLDPGVLSSST